jgi:hypothetical protein
MKQENLKISTSEKGNATHSTGTYLFKGFFLINFVKKRLRDPQGIFMVCL